MLILGLTLNQTTHAYSTAFDLPLSATIWNNGHSDGLDWCDVKSFSGQAFGSETGQIKYDDSTALLKGNWGPDQKVEATVFSKNQSEQVYEEVEIRLRSALSPHKATGYEINFRCLKTGAAYCQIVRWNGKLGDFTYLDARSGADFGVKNGDVVKATIEGNKIIAFINGKPVVHASDDTYKTGLPGIGFYLEGPALLNSEFGFTTLSAHD